jgi:putative hemolysin
VDGLLSYGDAEDRIGLPPRSAAAELGDFDTVAGMLLALFQHIPEAGETTTWQGWRFEVVDMDGVRIDKVLAQPPMPTDQTQTEAALAIGAALPPAHLSEASREDQATN